jgi:ATP-dependent Clp protease ATP-binding subunit ClpB
MSQSDCRNATSAIRFLPDKAIDLLDEACASFRLNCTRTKNGLEGLKRKQMSLSRCFADKDAETSDDKLDETTRNKLRAFNDEFEELHSLWKRTVK